MKPKLSVALATYNEAENITRCLQSVKKIADEIVVVDGESTDDTASIAQELGAKVIYTTNKPIFHINKQKAVDLCTGDWILALDADEEVSPALAQEIKEVIALKEDQIRQRRNSIGTPKQWQLLDRHQALLAERDGEYSQSSEHTDAFFLPRVNIFLDHPMRHTGVYPDGVIRLFRKHKARFPAKSVHEQVQVDGRVDWLVNDLYHYDSPTFKKYLTRANRYTSLTAQELRKNKVTINFFNTLNYFILKPLKTFIQLFIRHKGYKDGYAGFVFSLMSGMHHTIAFIKYFELERVSE